MDGNLIKGQRSFHLAEGAKKGSIILENDSDEDFHDLIMHLNDASWDTPEFRKIYVHKMSPKENTIAKEQISVVGGDLTSDEHPKWSNSDRIKPGERLKVEFWLNDELGDKAFLTVTPTDKRGGVIIGGSEKPPEDVTPYDKLMELIDFISKLKSIVSSLGLLSAAKEESASEGAATLLATAAVEDGREISKASIKELKMLERDAELLSERLLTVLEAGGLRA